MGRSVGGKRAAGKAIKEAGGGKRPRPESEEEHDLQQHDATRGIRAMCLRDDGEGGTHATPMQVHTLLERHATTGEGKGWRHGHTKHVLMPCVS